jgi:hypothetical protein
MNTCSNGTIDRVLMIQRSMRCFYYGLIGLIPVIGLVMAVLAIRLYHRVIWETGEKFARSPRWGRVAMLYALCWGAFTFASVADVPLWILSVLLFFGFQVFLWRMQYWPVTASEWNPARAHLFWGYQFAVNGLLSSLVAACLVLLIFSNR